MNQLGIFEDPCLESRSVAAQRLDLVELQQHARGSQGVSHCRCRHPVMLFGIGARRRGRTGNGHPRGAAPPNRFMGARINDVIAFTYARRAQRRLAYRETREHS